MTLNLKIVSETATTVTLTWSDIVTTIATITTELATLKSALAAAKTAVDVAFTNADKAIAQITADVATLLPVTLTGMTLSNAIIPGGSPIGTVVGTVTVLASNGMFSGSLAMSSTNFALKDGVLSTAKVLPAGTYTTGITAAMAGAVGSPMSKLFTVTAKVALKTESPSNTMVTMGETGAIIDATGAQWTIDAQDHVLRDGIPLQPS